MKVAFIDLDGVVADATKRFEHAEHLTSMQYDKSRQSKLWTDLYWRTVFTPEHVTLDTLIADLDVEKALDQLEEDGYDLVFLTSRPESMRAATRIWLQQHRLWEQVRVAEMRQLVMKPAAFYYTKTVTWKAGTVQMLASLSGATEVLVIDDEDVNVNELQRFTAAWTLRCYKSLALEEPTSSSEEDDDHPF